MRVFVVTFLVLTTWDCIEKGILGQSTTLTTLKFDCDNHGKITNISTDSLSLAELFVADENFCNLNDTSCGVGKSELHIVVHDQAKTLNIQQPTIIGGKNTHFYELACKLSDFDGTATASVNIAHVQATYIPDAHTYAPTKTDIALTIEKEDGGQLANTVKLGEKMSLKFKGPVDYIVDPFNCIAYPDKVKSSTSRELWSNKTCSSTDTAILEDHWTKDKSKNNIISITMYAFRFPASNTVSIECSAHFCPESDQACNTKCWKKNENTIGRRRRNAFETSHGKDHYMQKVSTFFTVVDDSETTNRSSGTSVNTFLYLATIAIILRYFV